MTPAQQAAEEYQNEKIPSGASAFDVSRANLRLAFLSGCRWMLEQAEKNQFDVQDENPQAVVRLEDLRELMEEER